MVYKARTKIITRKPRHGRNRVLHGENEANVGSPGQKQTRVNGINQPGCADSVFEFADNEMLMQQHFRKDAEQAVALLTNRIALLAGEEQRSKRRIKQMRTVIEKVERCKQEQAEMKAKNNATRNANTQNRINRTAELREQAILRKQVLATKKQEQLNEKQRIVANKRNKSKNMIERIREERLGEPRKHNEIMCHRHELKKKKELSQNEHMAILETKKQQRLIGEVERRTAAQTKIKKMAEEEKRMLERLRKMRQRQQEVHVSYEALHTKSQARNRCHHPHQASVRVSTNTLRGNSRKLSNDSSSSPRFNRNTNYSYTSDLPNHYVQHEGRADTSENMLSTKDYDDVDCASLQ